MQETGARATCMMWRFTEEKAWRLLWREGVWPSMPLKRPPNIFRVWGQWGQASSPWSFRKAPRWCGDCKGNLPHNMPYPFSEGVNTLLPTPAIPKYHNLIFFSNLLSWWWWLNIHGMLWCQHTLWNFRNLFFFSTEAFLFSFRWSQFWREVERMTNASNSKTRNCTKKASILSFHDCVLSPQCPTLRRRGKHRI